MKLSDLSPDDYTIVSTPTDTENNLKGAINLDDLSPGDYTLVSGSKEKINEKPYFNRDAFLQGFGQFGLAGYLPEATAAAGSLFPDPSRRLDESLTANGFKIQQAEDSYSNRLNDARLMQKRMEQESPGSYYTGGVAGAIATAPLYSKALDAAGVGGEVLNLKTPEGAAFLQKALAGAANLGSRVVKGMREGAAIGLIQNPATEPGQQQLSAESMGKRLDNVGYGMEIGGAIPLAASAIKGGYQGSKNLLSWIGTRIVSNVGGVKPEFIKEYLQYSDRINKAPSVEKLKDITDSFVGQLQTDLEQKKINYEDAKEIYKNFVKDVKEKYQTKAYDAWDDLNTATFELKEAHGNKLKALSQDLYDTINRLKSDVNAGSAKSYEILENSNEKFAIAPIRQKIAEQIDKLKIAGQAAIGEDASSAVNQLKTLQKTLESFPDEVPATEAKKMLQQLQRSTEYNKQAGTYSGSMDAAYKEINKAINSELKDIPGYAEQMKKVAADTELLSQVSEFGDRQSSITLLQKIKSPNQLERRKAIERLGEKYNYDFIHEASPESLPEHLRVIKADIAKTELRPDRRGKLIEKDIAQQQKIVSEAEKDLIEAKEKFAPYKPIGKNEAGQSQTQQKLEALGLEKNIEVERMFKELTKLSNIDFAQAMKDNRIQRAFKAQATNGARNAARFGAVGLFMGGPLGAGIGAVIGGVFDQWGPAITKKFLDGVIKVKNFPSVETIRKLDLPEPLKKQLEQGLRNFQLNNNNKSKGETAWVNRGIENLDLNLEYADKLRNDPKARGLLIQASEMEAGSRALEKIRQKIREGWGL